VSDPQRAEPAHLDAIRDAFDRGFAQAATADDVAQDDLLLVGIAGDRYAVRLHEIAGVFADKTVRRLPSTVPAFIGLVGLRGAILPVYDLRVCFGYAATTPQRWLLMAASAPVVLACDRFDGHRRVQRTAITPIQRTGKSAPQVREIVTLIDGVRPVIHMPSVTDAIAALARMSVQPKE
jgi:chemotaxis signal transduction protein